MIVDIQQLETVKYKFTDLGRTIQSLSDKNEDLFEDTLKALKEGFQPLIETLSAELLKSVSSVSRIQEGFINQANAEKLHAEFFIKSSQSVESFGKIVIDINSMDKFNALFKDKPTDFLLKAKLDKKGRVTGFNLETQKRARTTLQKEWGGIKNIVSGFMHKTYLPAPGNVAATLLGVVGFGYMTHDRIRAEAGEVSNILVEAVDSSVKGMVARGREQVSQLQESLQKFYGISKSETQAAAASLIRGGISIEEMLGSLDTGIKGVKDNYLTFSFALDKMFDLAGGTTGYRMIQVMADYGKNFEDARKSVYEMMMAGKESGIGTMNFLKGIETAGDTLKRFGFDIDDVVKLSVTLQDGFEKLGVPKQFAGKFAAEGIQGLASSVANMSQDMMAYMGVRMGYEKQIGPKAAQAFENALDRIKRAKESDNGSDEFIEVIHQIASVAMEQANNDPEMAKWFMRHSELNLSVPAAEAALKVKEYLDRGDKISARKVQKETMHEFQNSFMKEKEKMSKFQGELNRVLQGVSDMGQAIMGLVVGAASYTIITFQALYWRFNDLTLPELLAWLATGSKPARSKSSDFEENEKKIAKAYAAVGESMNRSVDKLASGWEKFTGGLANMGEDFLGPSFKALKQAVDLRSIAGGGDTIESQLASPTTTVIRTIPVIIQAGGGPTGERQKYGLLSPTDVDEMSAQEAEGGDEEGGGWVGGNLYIVSDYVDESGNLHLRLIGNCPRCGVRFGSESSASVNQEIASLGYSERDVEAVAKTVTSEMTSKFGGNPYASDTAMKEATGIGWTILNRLRDPNQSHGSSAYDVVTKGKGYGEQGVRPYSTAKEATPESMQFARELLADRYADPTGGATLFFHDYGKAYSYGIPKGGDPSKGSALPDFTKNATNTMNLDTDKGITLRTYKQGKGREDPRAAALDKEDREKWEQAFGGERLSSHRGKFE